MTCINPAPISLHLVKMAGSPDSSSFILYLDDVGEEVEIEASVSLEGDSCSITTKSKKSAKRTGRKRKQVPAEAEGSTTSKRKRKVLSKKEKARVMLSLCDVDIGSVLAHVKATIESEKHIEGDLARLDFWKCLEKSEALMKQIMISLMDAFANLYKICDKGKDKYMNFQLEWHRHCSAFLLPSGKDISDVDYDLQKYSRLQQRWLGFCEGKAVNTDVRCSIMISLCDAVYKYFLKLVSSVQQSLLDESPNESTVIEPDTNSVYYRFCGAAIAEMLHGRYSKRQNCTPSSKLSVNGEIQVLKCIQCVNKDHIPQELKYRDNGHMYFPAVEFLPFLRALDQSVMENANVASFKKYGAHFIEVAATQVHSNQELLKQFVAIISGMMSERQLNVEQYQREIQSVYKELSRKLCHTRLAEFVSVTQQVAAAEQGKTTLAGQNLRDQLLCFHVNTKSQLK